MCLYTCTRRDQSNVQESLASTLWALGIELSSSDLAADALPAEASCRLYHVVLIRYMPQIMLVQNSCFLFFFYTLDLKVIGSEVDFQA